jgi:hypothetical protein
MHALEFKKRTKAPRSLTRQVVKSKPSRRGSNKHSEYSAIEYVLSPSGKSRNRVHLTRFAEMFVCQIVLGSAMSSGMVD